MEFRKYQKEVINKAIECFEIGFKNVLIDAPTGFGKSFVNYMIAKHFRSAFYTTPQVVLLDQIEKDRLLQEIAVVKGRSNYPCTVEPNKTAANGKCVRVRRYVCKEECPYRVAKYRAMNSQIAAMSFAYLIYDRFLPEGFSFGNRELIIVDEADDLESWAEEFGSFKFKVRQNFEDISDVIEWAKIVRANVSQRISMYESMSSLNDKDVSELEKLRKYAIKLDVFLDKVQEDRDNWVFEVKDGTLIVKPVNVGEILEDLVWSRGKYRIASSATIINREMFCKYCGLDEEKTAIIKVPAIFPKEIRPVYYVPVAKMTKNCRANGYGALVDAISKIAEKHYGERGLIHAHSYEIANEIYRRLSLNRPVIFHDKDTRKDAFKRFIETENSVFLSVGFARGIDLKYDLCRWQVITKVPFPDQGDVRVRELWVNRKAWNWARYQAIKSLVQACGRIVRAEDDFGATYILDESFEYLFRYKSQFPKWFVESVILGGDMGG